MQIIIPLEDVFYLKSSLIKDTHDTHDASKITTYDIKKLYLDRVRFTTQIISYKMKIQNSLVISTYKKK